MNRAAAAAAWRVVAGRSRSVLFLLLLQLALHSERRHKHQGQDAKCRRVELYPPTIPLWGCHSAPCSSSKFDQHHYTDYGVPRLGIRAEFVATSRYSHFRFGGAKAEAVAMQMQQHSPASSYAETDCADSDSDDSGCGDCQCRLEA
ncbi:hypothetical protein PF010_g25115 [Phytophthora fragariae]|uniref:Secreted protein n=1 Tax=Phytophthora fragariae TaxID=53985 RepID=A0A6G0K0M6_9STRA|nr:hypothetical protein PF010_g25115 [Phytophthora fragariae]